MYPVSSAQFICCIAAMAKLGNLLLVGNKKTGEQVNMVTKPRTLGLLGHRGLYNDHIIYAILFKMVYPS